MKKSYRPEQIVRIVQDVQVQLTAARRSLVAESTSG